MVPYSPPNFSDNPVTQARRGPQTPEAQQAHPQLAPKTLNPTTKIPDPPQTKTREPQNHKAAKSPQSFASVLTDHTKPCWQSLGSKIEQTPPIAVSSAQFTKPSWSHRDVAVVCSYRPHSPKALASHYGPLRRRYRIIARLL